MYDQIPLPRYYHYRDKLRTEERIPDFPSGTGVFGQISFNIIFQTLVYVQNDYAAFLAHCEEWKETGNRMDSIHLGLQVAHAMTSLWDHMGYGLAITFGLPIPLGQTRLLTAVQALKDGADSRLGELCNHLLRLYDDDSPLRKKYRNPWAHEIHENFIQRSTDDDSRNKLQRMERQLEASYDHLKEGLRLYRRIMGEYAPHINYGFPLQPPVQRRIISHRLSARRLPQAYIDEVRDAIGPMILSGGPEAVPYCSPNKWDRFEAEVHNHAASTVAGIDFSKVRLSLSPAIMDQTLHVFVDIIRQEVIGKLRFRLSLSGARPPHDQHGVGV